MFMRTIGRHGIKPFIVCALSLAVPLANGQAPVSASQAPAPSSEIEQLRQMILEQQRQIDELKRAMADRKTAESATSAKPETSATSAVASAASSSPSPSVSAMGGIGEVASTAAILPPIPALTTVAVPLPTPQAAVAAPSDAVQKALDAINANLRGFRLSGDLRFRSDIQVRESNPNFAPVQRARERYRFRFNIDKDLFYKDGDRAMASFHVQLATDPFNNPSTMDTDFAGVSTRAPISISEAYIDFRPTKSLTLRAGRTAELFADNRQFVYDDDIRFNGFHETYRWTGRNNGLFVQFAAAQYLLTDPNTQIVPPGSPFISIGYPQGTRVPSSGLFDQGITVGSNIGKKWSHNETFNFFAVREPNQIQLASTANGAALFANNPIVGAVLIGNLPETGNATTTLGGPVYFADGFEVVRGAFNLNYSGKSMYGHNYPFQFMFQATHNTKASIQNNGFMGGFAFGQTARLGDMQFQYQYFRKEANAFVSQFTDDDIGSGSGVNLKGHEIRVNFGLTRFLAWENRLYIQNGISRNDPGNNFFVPLQQGYNTQYRIHSQFVFTF
jgi:hypothetical protein